MAKLSRLDKRNLNMQYGKFSMTPKSYDEIGAKMLMELQKYKYPRIDFDVQDHAVLISIGRHDGLGLYFAEPNVIITPNDRRFSWLHDYQERFYTVDTLGM